MSFDASQYIPTIDAILRVSDLNVVSAKRVRTSIQELLGVDLREFKKPLEKVILERFRIFQEKSDDSESDVTEKNKKTALKIHSQVKQTELRAASREQKSAARKAVKQHKDKLKAEKKAKKEEDAKVAKSNKEKALKKREAEQANAPRENKGFHLQYQLSPILAQNLGEQKLSRPQVVKHLWMYIKDKNLQNPENLREILWDEPMWPIFGKSR